MNGVPGVMVLLSHVSLLDGSGTLMPYKELLAISRQVSNTKVEYIQSKQILALLCHQASLYHPHRTLPHILDEESCTKQKRVLAFAWEQSVTSH